MDRLLDVYEAAALLRVSPRTVYAWSYQGLIPRVRLGGAKRGALRFKERDLRDWIEARRLPGGGEEKQ